MHMSKKKEAIDAVQEEIIEEAIMAEEPADEKVARGEFTVEARPDIMRKAGLDDLPGVGMATAQKLKDAGFADQMAIAVATPGELVEATGISEAVARKMIQAARDSLEMGFESGVDLLKKRERVIRVSTGSKKFDEMLGGGFETGSIV